MGDEDSLDDFPEMTPAQEEYVLWAMSSDVDTGGFCDCGHGGLGPSWHRGDCRGANHALTKKVGELLERSTSAEAALRVMARETDALSQDRTPAGFRRLNDLFTKSRGEILRLEDEVESLRAKVAGLVAELRTSRSVRDSLLKIASGLTEQLRAERDGSALADRLAAERPQPSTADFAGGWIAAVDMLRRMAAPYRKDTP